MPALEKTEYSGTVSWLGRVVDREASLTAIPVEQLNLRFSGPEGEAHGGLTRASCGRVMTQHPFGTEIRNVRQLSVVSAEELVQVAAEMGLETLEPELIGATLVISGLPDLSHLPPSSRLQAANGATVVVDMQNRPCTLPARPIEGAYPGKGIAFKPAAKQLRGVTAWVEREGVIRIGDTMTLHIPDQRPWMPTVSV